MVNAPAPTVSHGATTVPPIASCAVVAATSRNAPSLASRAQDERHVAQRVGVGVVAVQVGDERDVGAAGRGRELA